MGKALYEESIENDGLLQVCSMYDRQRDAYNNPYFPAENFRGFGIKKIKFIKEMVQAGFTYNRIVLSHINLLPVGWLIKKLAPDTEIVLLAHGIEIWYPVSKRKKRMLHKCDTILAVSNYTRNTIIHTHGLEAGKIKVLNNCLDPFLPLPSVFAKSEILLNKYGFKETDIILMSLTRLASKERYKGYDKVIEAIADLKAKYPHIRYLIAGRYDSREKAFIDNLLVQRRISNMVVITGFVPDKELEAHFAMSDMYVMPSRKEGFGIVFIEAMYYGLPVIAGNADGSSDALLAGGLGQLVTPDDVEEIAQAIENILKNETSFTPDRNLLLEHFSYEVYKQKLEGIMDNYYQPALSNASIAFPARL